MPLSSPVITVAPQTIPAISVPSLAMRPKSQKPRRFVQGQMLMVVEDVAAVEVVVADLVKVAVEELISGITLVENGVTRVLPMLQ
jgi:hypothetical protein